MNKNEIKLLEHEIQKVTVTMDLMKGLRDDPRYTTNMEGLKAFDDGLSVLKDNLTTLRKELDWKLQEVARRVK